MAKSKSWRTGREREKKATVHFSITVYRTEIRYSNVDTMEHERTAYWDFGAIECDQCVAVEKLNTQITVASKNTARWKSFSNYCRKCCMAFVCVSNSILCDFFCCTKSIYLSIDSYSIVIGFAEFGECLRSKNAISKAAAAAATPPSPPIPSYHQQQQ